MSSRKRHAESAKKSDLPPNKRSKRAKAKHVETEAISQPELRFENPEGFEVVPPARGNVAQILTNALATTQKEIWLIAVPRDFNKKKLYGKKIVVGTSMTLKNRKNSSKSVGDHFEVRAQPLPKEGRRLSVLVRTRNGIESVGPVTTSLTVKRVVHIDPVCSPAHTEDSAAARRTPLTGAPPDKAMELVELIRQRRTMIGSDMPVVKCGYAETKRRKKETKKKTLKKTKHLKD